MTFFSKIFGDPNERMIRRLSSVILEINDLEPRFVALGDDGLRAEADKLKKLLVAGKTLDEILPQSFALTREAAKRTLHQRHYDSQLVGGIILHRGMIAEMKTGEGKTLVATLPATLNALTGRGVHVVTVNDYLSLR
ncbi:MAG: preprotein translocase subunit SecA, partial [Candidatus Niyogibacteria bacterium]|nr:preprotein translocase subunit SecA [Candidatus Niyogibacteria bacterium]